jgi:hypothetical protein
MSALQVATFKLRSCGRTAAANRMSHQDIPTGRTTTMPAKPKRSTLRRPTGRIRAALNKRTRAPKPGMKRKPVARQPVTPPILDHD